MPRIRVPARPLNKFQGFSPLDNFFLGVGVLFQISGMLLAWIGKPPYLLLTFFFLALYYLVLLVYKFLISLKRQRPTIRIPRLIPPLPPVYFSLPKFRFPHTIFSIPYTKFPLPRASSSFKFLLLSFVFLAVFFFPLFYIFKDLPRASELTDR